jgi:hypothetical protein
MKSMAATPARIAFQAELLRPATPRAATWSFILVPPAASAKLPTRGMTTVEGTFEGARFKATLEPDGRGGHWLRIPKSLREAARAQVGARVALEFAPCADTLEPRVPADLRAALAANPAAREQWRRLTPIARRDWIQWLDSAKQATTRARRIASSCDMLVEGKRRVCCFDRSGRFSKAMAAPEAVD